MGSSFLFLVPHGVSIAVDFFPAVFVDPALEAGHDLHILSVLLVQNLFAFLIHVNGGQDFFIAWTDKHSQPVHHSVLSANLVAICLLTPPRTCVRETYRYRLSISI